MEVIYTSLKWMLKKLFNNKGENMAKKKKKKKKNKKKKNKGKKKKKK